MPNLAVIDCGTNTFHLLIAAPKADGGFAEIYRERRFIKLAEEGISSIGAAAYQRALDALTDYAAIIKQYEVVAQRVSGTAAMRTASNGPDLRAEVAAQTGLQIDIIPGKEEAQLIYQGVAQAIGPQSSRWMVMDIGGGSVEFIIVDEQGVRWFESFPVGVAVLYKQLHQTEPISDEEIALTRLFLRAQLTPLQLALARYPTHHLVGAAGTFDVIAQVLGVSQPTPHCHEVQLDGFDRLYRRVISADRAARHAMTDIPDDRADMIVVALILVQLILEIAKIDQLTVSDFSMKEGMLAQMMTKQ
jgi:exopolyphosphatase/guanosine-5'-triphosphate,3'-diphosphate pyrophosphatase